jgi:hypothetical protein
MRILPMKLCMLIDRKGFCSPRFDHTSQSPGLANPCAGLDVVLFAIPIPSEPVELRFPICVEAL